MSGPGRYSHVAVAKKLRGAEPRLTMRPSPQAG